MIKQDSGFKGRMDDCLFTVVEEPSTLPAKQTQTVKPVTKSSKSPEEGQVIEKRIVKAI